MTDFLSAITQTIQDVITTLPYLDCFIPMLAVVILASCIGITIRILKGGE